MTDGSLVDETEKAYAQARAYGKDLARLYAAEKTRRKEFETTSQKLQAIFDTVPNGLAVVDNDLTIVEANPRFLALFEQTLDCVGRPLASLLPIEALQASMASLETAPLATGSIEVSISQPVPRDLLITLSSLSNHQGWVLILHDQTERNRLEGLKNEFINIAAHELRTPLAGVIGFASVLNESFRKADNAMVAELITLILQSTDRLKLIVDELVEFAAIHRESEDSLHIVDIDVERLLQKSLKVLQPRMEAKEITCRLELPASPFIVQGDPLILGEVIYHLLDNAVRFNKPNGQITIRIHQISTPSKTGTSATVIEIEDTGIGIPQTELNKIFDKFYQVEEHMTRVIGGLGLGLAIARRGIEQHGGRLTVTSQLGQGSVFQLILPPITSRNDVSIDDRADMAHQQTLAYAKDMARAVVAERQMMQKIKDVQILSARLEKTLARLSNATAAQDNLDLAEAQDIVEKLLQLSDQAATL